MNTVELGALAIAFWSGREHTAWSDLGSVERHGDMTLACYFDDPLIMWCDGITQIRVPWMRLRGERAKILSTILAYKGLPELEYSTDEETVSYQGNIVEPGTWLVIDPDTQAPTDGDDPDGLCDYD